MIRSLASLILLTIIIVSCQSSHNFTSKKYRKGFRYAKLNRTQSAADEAQKKPTTSFVLPRQNRPSTAHHSEKTEVNLTQTTLPEEESTALNQPRVQHPIGSDALMEFTESTTVPSQEAEVIQSKWMKESRKRQSDISNILLATGAIMLLLSLILFPTWLILFLFAVLEAIWVLVPVGLLVLGIGVIVIAFYVW